jgi:hypothetical protein
MTRYTETLAALFRLASCVLLISFSIAAHSQTPLKVCADPSAPCQSPNKAFAPYELSFHLPKRLKANVDYKSAPFFAVILKTKAPTADEECDKGEYSSKLERERKQVQSLFPERKVFADNQCPDMGAVAYMINGKANTGMFLAVYGGETQMEAEVVLAKIRAKYRSASVKKMQVVFEQIEQ